MFFSFFTALSSQPIPSFYNGVLVFPGNRWFPCFTFLQTEHVLYLSLGKSHFLFFSFFPSFSSDSFESSWLAIFFGMCWGMPFSASPFFGSFHFSLFFLIWAESCSANLKATCYHSFFFCASLFWFPEVFFYLCHGRSLGFTGACVLLLLFLIFFFCLFLSSCPSLPLSLCLKESVPLDGS